MRRLWNLPRWEFSKGGVLVSSLYFPRVLTRPTEHMTAWICVHAQRRSFSSNVLRCKPLDYIECKLLKAFDSLRISNCILWSRLTSLPGKSGQAKIQLVAGSKSPLFAYGSKTHFIILLQKIWIGWQHHRYCRPFMGTASRWPILIWASFGHCSESEGKFL